MASKKLERQTKYWVEKGIINQNQAKEIMAYPYEAQLQVSGNNYKVLATIGSVLISVGILIIFASNWDSISPNIKMALALLSTIGFYTTGYFLRFKKEMPKLGNAIFFIGAVLYGGTIFLIGQIFNFQSDYSTGYLIWFLGIIPLVYLLKSKSIAILSVLVSLAFISAYYSNKGGLFSQFGILLIIASASLWIAIGYWHEKLDHVRYLRNPYQMTALFIWAIPSLFLTTRWSDSALFISKLPLGLHVILGVVLILVLSLVLASWLEKKMDASLLIAPTFTVITITLIYLPQLFGTPRSFDNLSRFPASFIIANLIFFIGLLTIILVAHKQRQPLLAYSVSVLFGIGIIVRYFELASDYLSGQFGLVLLGAGVLLLLAGGGLEAQRRRFKNA